MTSPRAAAALAAAAVLIGLAAPSAAAQSEDQLIVTVGEPRDAPPLSSSTVAVSGEVAGREELSRLLLGSQIDWVTVKLRRAGDSSLVGEYDACRPCPVRDGRVPFSATIAGVNANGRYWVEVAAYKAVLAPGVAELKGSAQRAFGVAAPPRAPQDVKVEVSPERVVTVSWERNTEPDILGYTVLRKDPNAEAYRPAALNVAQPDTPRVSFPDSQAALVGGEFTYQVRAIRPGATPGSRVLSEPSTTEPVSLGAPTPTGAGTGPGSGLLGTFPSAQTNSTAARPRTVEAPDTGFSEALPFGAAPSEEAQVEEPAEPRTLDLGTPETEFAARGRPLVPVAAGAVLLLLAIHVRLLTKRMDAPSPSPVAGARADEVNASDLDYFDGRPSVPRSVPRSAPRPAPAPAVAHAPQPPHRTPSRQPLYDWAQLPGYARAPAVATARRENGARFDGADDDEWAREYAGRTRDRSREAVASPVR